MKISRLVIYFVAATITIVAVAACRATPTPTLPPPPTTPPPTPTPSPTAEPTQTTGICGQQGGITVLLLGESLSEDRSVRGANAIRLVRVDYDTRTVRVLALPPYLWVDTPALSAEQIDATALAYVYQEALQSGPGSDRAKMAHAANVLAQTLTDNFGLVVDHSVSIKQGTFTNTIDTLGGLSIELAEDVNLSLSGSGVYSAGLQTLDGQAVLEYVSGYSTAGIEPLTEWERLDRQNQVLQALFAQVTRPETLLKLPELLQQLYQDVVTDMGLSQFLILTCMMQESLSIEYLKLDPALVTPGEDKILLPKTDEIIKYLETEFVQ
jgi:anionic cell wall polymer biosynthesis LytR-Cps2A-Psr (LCP) family protein